jgi:hypothetical protein
VPHKGLPTPRLCPVPVLSAMSEMTRNTSRHEVESGLSTSLNMSQSLAVPRVISHGTSIAEVHLYVQIMNPSPFYLLTLMLSPNIHHFVLERSSVKVNKSTGGEHSQPFSEADPGAEF